MNRSTATLLAGALALATGTEAQQIRYPETRRSHQTDDYHGTRVADPYRWLEDTDAPETRRWIEAQNRLTAGWLAGVPQRAAIARRLTELWNYERWGVPFRRGGRVFSFRNDGLQNQSVLYVQPSLADAPRVLLDPNALSPDGTVSLSTTSVSEDGRLLAYGVSSGGSDWQEFRVRDVDTGRDLPDRVRWVKFSGAEWTPDGRGFFYARYPEPTGNALTSALANQRLYYHRVGTPQSEDVLVYERPDRPTWGFDPEVTDDGRWLVVTVWEGSDPANRVFVRDLGDPAAPRLTGGMLPLMEEADAGWHFVGSRGTVLYFRTDAEAPRGRIVAVDLRAPERSAWRTVVPQTEDALTDARIVDGHFVAEYLHDAHSRVRLLTLEGRPVRDLELPTLGSVGAVTGEQGDTEIFYSFTSFLYPSTVFRHELRTGRTETVFAPKTGFDPARYTTEQVFYTSRDGARVPMFLTYRKDLERDGSNPTQLYGYGGFSWNLTPFYSVPVLVWLEMGGIYATPNLRGGAEYGEEWHRAGMLERKQNVFDDFIAAAEYLVREKYTSPEKLAVSGDSNGGLLVGAVVNQRPELFGASLPAVGVMDMLRYHKFTIGWGWVPEYGSADDPRQFPWLYAYSPLHNLRPGARYPATLVTTGDHDDRVVPGHSFKYAAALQAAQGGEAPVLVPVETRAGHGAGKPTSMQIEEAADKLAFLVRVLGMRPAGM
ncbi:MAG: prolyl oligopeptidase family serine peptidase [Gemmatimonadota bacterium]